MAVFNEINSDYEESQSDGEPESDFVSHIESDDQLILSEAELQSPDGSALTRPTEPTPSRDLR